MQRQMLATLQNAPHKGGLRALGPHLHERACPTGVHRLNDLDELHRRGHLLREKIANRLLTSRPRGVIPTGHVGENRHPRRAHLDVAQVPTQRAAGRGHHLGMKGVTHRQERRLKPHLLKESHRLTHRLTQPGDDRLRGAVDIRADHISVDAIEHRLHHLHRRTHPGHQPGVTVHRRHFGHLRAPGGHRAQRVRKAHDPGRHTRPVLPEAVARDHLRNDPKLPEQAIQGDIRRQHRGLGDLGLRQRSKSPALGLRSLQRPRIDHLAEPPPQHRQHHLISLLKGAAHHLKALFERREHPQVLRALPREEHRQLSAHRLLSQHHPLVRQHLPALIATRRTLCALESFLQLLHIAKSHRQTHLPLNAAPGTIVFSSKRQTPRSNPLHTSMSEALHHLVDNALQLSD